MRCVFPLLWVVPFLLSLSLTIPFVTGKECGTATRGKQVKEMTSKSHVLVALLTDPPNDTAVWKELCERLTQTPEARVTDFSIVSVVDHSTQKKLWDQSRPEPTRWWERILYKVEKTLPASIQKFVPRITTHDSSSKPSLPTFILFPQGDSYDSASGLRYQVGEEEELTVDEVSSFVSIWLQRKKLGNFVYSMNTYDTLAAQTMDLVETRGHAHWMTQLWVRGVMRLTRYMVHPTSLAHEQELIQLYEKSALKVMEEGSLVPTKQIERLERMLEGGGSSGKSISPLQREQLGQRLYIWKRFAEPVPFTPGDVRNILYRLLVNMLSLAAIAIVVPYLMLTTEEVEEQKDDEKEEAEGKTTDGDNPEGAQEEKDEEPVEEAASKPLSKKEQIAVAQAKAKALMADDKAKVQALKARNAAGGGAEDASPPMYTEHSLNVKTVVELREMLKSHGLSVSGKKHDLVNRLLETQTAP